MCVIDLQLFCSFILSKTATWGYLKNGKFDGMIGALVRKQADIGGSPIFFRIERAKVIDYTTRTWVARYRTSISFFIFIFLLFFVIDLIV